MTARPESPLPAAWRGRTAAAAAAAGPAAATAPHTPLAPVAASPTPQQYRPASPLPPPPPPSSSPPPTAYPLSNGGAAGVHLQSPAYTDPSSAPLQLSSTAAVAVAVTTVAAAQVVVGYEPCGDDGACYVREFPRRPGKQQCEFYAKTGHCKFGDTCCFDHPPEFAVQLSPLGLPLRPDQVRPGTQHRVATQHMLPLVDFLGFQAFPVPEVV